jgi:hypothetical protein
MDALEVSCPECHVRKHKPCVYIQPNVPRTPSSEWMYLRAGQPTKKPHNGRAQKAWFTQRAAELDAQRAAYAEQNAASADREAILKANARAVTDEHNQLRAWLQQHARIFDSTERSTT